MRGRYGLDDSVCGSRADRCDERPILARNARYEPSLRIRVDELHRLGSVQCRDDIRRRHFAQEKQQLAVAERLARERMLSATFDDVRDIPIGETHRVRLVGDHGSQERVDSWHTVLTTQSPGDNYDVPSGVEVRLSPSHFALLDLHRDVPDSEESHRVVNVLQHVLLS